MLRQSYVSVLPPASALLVSAFRKNGDNGELMTLEAPLWRQTGAASMRDHCVRGRAVVPAAAYLELATATATNLSGTCGFIFKFQLRLAFLDKCSLGSMLRGCCLGWTQQCLILNRCLRHR